MYVELSQPFQDQKPGTSGLRKKVTVFQQPHYTESFIQAIISAIDPGASLVIGGDGRYYNKHAIHLIASIALANGVKRLIIGQSGILSTPAASNLIRLRKATGGILLTASHNPGGPTNDFGIKYNIGNGGPAPEGITSKIFELTKGLKGYNIEHIKELNLDSIGEVFFKQLTIEIVHSVDDYVAMVKEIFDFDAIKHFLVSTPNFSFLFDAMHAGNMSLKSVTGPYAFAIFVKELGITEKSIINGVPLEDFGGGHPDPNLTYAHELVTLVENNQVDLGAASDGDGDRNMIIGKGTFVNPSDSVAIIAANASIIPYFRDNGIKGLARSMPTSAAIDRVAKKIGVPIYEVPTGWKFFGNLMDSGLLSICGEESFGTGSDHIREKDGIWAVLAWMSIIAHTNLHTPGTTLKNILEEHYSIYGRNYFSRYDYEDVDSNAAAKVFEQLKGLTEDKAFIGRKFGTLEVQVCDDFSYLDPIDHSLSTNQGIRVIFTEGSRIIFRLSGTGSQGATIRLYVEKYDDKNTGLATQDAMKELIDIALKISNLTDFTGRNKPTVVT